MAASLYKSVRKRGDWFLFVLLIAAVLCLPSALQATKWAPDSGPLLYLALGAAVCGVLLARSPLPDWLAWLVGVFWGLATNLEVTGKVLPAWNVVAADVSRAVGWLWQAYWHRLAVGAAFPAPRAPAFVWSRLQLMLTNLAAWYATVQKGEASRDTTALMLGVVIVLWLLAWHAGFELFRRRRTFMALLPLGVALVANVSFSDDIGLIYVHIYLAVTLVTLVWANTGRMESVWARLGMDFSPELRRDAVLAGSGLASVIFVAALFMPYVTYDKAVWGFWNRYGSKFKTFYDSVDRSFAGRNPVPSPTPNPRARGLAGHAVGGPGLTGQSTVFTVQTSDIMPDLPEEIAIQVMPEMSMPKHYWRERTYDLYTGHGWDNKDRKLENLAKDTPWTQPTYPYTILTQTFSLQTGRRDLAYAVNEPVSVNRDYRVITRGKDDFAALNINAFTYTVVSWIPDPTVDELKVAEGDYPDWVKDRFLPLPQIPQRVRQTADDVVRQAGAITRYDKAVALEAYLRGFTYDLTVEPPPLDADVVDYFLFKARRGYCDYSATAMVVMLRSVGVAARYASGYGMGTYDNENDQWVVNEENSHAWTEVYFPGYGWVEFEPTPAQGMFLRPLSRVGSLSLPDGAATPATTQVRIPPLWWGAGVLLLVVLFVVVWPPRWFERKRQPHKTVWRAYNNLLRGARWLGVRPGEGQTPREFLRTLAQHIARRVDLARGANDATVSPVSSGAAVDIALIETLYHQARYSDKPISHDDGYRAESAWRRLRGLIFRLAFVRLPAKPTAP